MCLGYCFFGTSLLSERKFIFPFRIKLKRVFKGSRPPSPSNPFGVGGGGGGGQEGVTPLKKKFRFPRVLYPLLPLPQRKKIVFKQISAK